MTPSEALQAICEAWNRLDNDALADLFDVAGTFEDPLHERVLTGREDIRTVNAPAMGALSECEVTLSAVLESGHTGLGEGMFRSALSDGGGRLDFPFAIAVELRDGLITRCTEYFDTAGLG
ncbi:MAG TPA: nuclear transport factor 2 family protein [Gaiellales bacterium]